MMDFPTSPTVGTIISFPGGQSYRWSGVVWDTVNPGLNDPYPFATANMQWHSKALNSIAVNSLVAGNGTDVTTIDNVGNFVTSGNATASASMFSTSFIGTTTATILATGAAGTVYLRPNGIASGAGQMSVASSGAVNVAAGLTATQLGVTSGGNDPVSFGITSGSYCRASYTVAGLRTWKAGCTSDAHFGISDETGASIILSVAQVGGGSTLLQGGFQITGSAWKPGGGSWADSSDERIKTVLGPFDRGLEHVAALNPVVYAFKGNDTNEEPNNGYDPEGLRAAETPEVPYPNSPHYHAAVDGKEFVGLIAQEVETVFPGMVTQRAAFIDGQPVSDLRDLDTATLIFALVNAIKELAAKVAALEAA